MRVSLVRQGLADAASAVVSDPPLKCLPYVPAGFVVPCMYVQVEPFKFDLAFHRGADELNLSLMLLVSRTDDRSAQELLDAYISGSGPASVKAAVEAEREITGRVTFGGSCHDAQVTGVEAYQWYDVGDGTKFLGAKFAVRCIGSGGT
jgi:hypothetical protein